MGPLGLLGPLGPKLGSRGPSGGPWAPKITKLINLGPLGALGSKAESKSGAWPRKWVGNPEMGRKPGNGSETRKWNIGKLIWDIGTKYQVP